jgi:hypothetical protein
VNDASPLYPDFQMLEFGDDPIPVPICEMCLSQNSSSSIDYHDTVVRSTLFGKKKIIILTLGFELIIKQQIGIAVLDTGSRIVPGIEPMRLAVQAGNFPWI